MVVVTNVPKLCALVSIVLTLTLPHCDGNGRESMTSGVTSSDSGHATGISERNMEPSRHHGRQRDARNERGRKPCRGKDCAEAPSIGNIRIASTVTKSRSKGSHPSHGRGRHPLHGRGSHPSQGRGRHTSRDLRHRLRLRQRQRARSELRSKASDVREERQNVGSGTQSLRPKIERLQTDNSKAKIQKGKIEDSLHSREKQNVQDPQNQNSFHPKRSLVNGEKSSSPSRGSRQRDLHVTDQLKSLKKTKISSGKVSKNKNKKSRQDHKKTRPDSSQKSSSEQRQGNKSKLEKSDRTEDSPPRKRRHHKIRHHRRRHLDRRRKKAREDAVRLHNKRQKSRNSDNRGSTKSSQENSNVQHKEQAREDDSARNKNTRNQQHSHRLRTSQGQEESLRGQNEQQTPKDHSHLPGVSAGDNEEPSARKTSSGKQEASVDRTLESRRRKEDMETSAGKKRSGSRHSHSDRPQVSPALSHHERRNRHRTNSRRDRMNPSRSRSDMSRGQTDSKRGRTDPRRGQTDPRRGQTDPRKDETDSRRGQTDPKRGQTDPRRGQTDPRRGKTDPRKDETDSRRGQTDPKKGQTDSRRGQTDPRRDRGYRPEARRPRGRNIGPGRYRGRYAGRDQYVNRYFDSNGRYMGRQAGRNRYRFLDAERYDSDVPRRPAAADRLERRLYPSLTSATRELMTSLQRTLSALGQGLRAVRDDNDFVFNGTRYNIMLGVRQQLMNIAQTNDIVYKTVLRASLLTKEIYLRAHQSQLTGPSTRSLHRPEMLLPSLRDPLLNASAHERQARLTLRDAEELNRKRQRVESRLRQVRERFQDNFARNDLRTLVYYVNSTAQRLSTDLLVSTQVAYAIRNKDILYKSRDTVREARDLLSKASDSLVKGAVDYRGNYRVMQDWRRLRDGASGGGVGPPVSIRLPPRRNPYSRARQHAEGRRRRGRRRQQRDTGELSPEERSRLLSLIQVVKRHVREQEKRANAIQRLVEPALKGGKSFLATSELSTSTLLASLLAQLDSDGKKLFSLLNSIRELIGGRHELRWVPLGKRRHCSDEEDEVEGSGCLPEAEGSGDLVLEESEDEKREGPTNTDDEDLFFVDETEKSSKMLKSTSLEEFGTSLSVYVQGVILRSNSILKSGDQLYDATKTLSREWSKAKAVYDAAEQADREWKSVQKVMANVSSHAENSGELTSVFHTEVLRSHDSIETRMKEAVKIAERKLAEAEAQKSGGDDPETERPSNDDTAVLAEAVEKVQKVRSNWAAVSSLRKVIPRTCGQASGTVMRLSANISRLQQQVSTARALLQDMQLSISKSGGGYYSTPVVQKNGIASSFKPIAAPVSMVTTVEVCLRTQDTDGTVLVVMGNNSDSFALTMDDRQITVTVYDAKGYNLDSITSDITMQVDTWYSVKVTRIGKTVHLRVWLRNGSGEVEEKELSNKYLAYLQPDPVHVYVGGMADSEPFSVDDDTWRGCLGELHVNGRTVPLLNAVSTEEAPKLCTSQCSQTSKGGSLVFEGAGFLHFPSSVLPMRKRLQFMHFLFRSSQSTAALLHLVNQRQGFLLRVVLDNGAVILEVTTSSESVTHRSRNSGYNDGAFHSLKVELRNGAASPALDGQENVFRRERSRPRGIYGLVSGIVIGGFVTSRYAFEKSQYRPLIGCIQELEIDDKPLMTSQAVTSTGVFSGTCDLQTVWSECVEFESSSKGVDLGDLDRSATVVLQFSRETRGPILTYSRKDSFESEVTVTEEGLHISVAGDKAQDLTIAAPTDEDISDDFVMLEISDGGKTVTYSAWGTSQSHQYLGFWTLAKDVDGPHEVKVAQPLDSTSDAKFNGQISQLLVGDRYISLSNYTTSNPSPCQRPLPTLVKVETQPDATSSPENTCSADIRCS